MKISLPVIGLDEALKFVSRNYIEGKEKSQIGGFITVLVMWFAFIFLLYAYPLFRVETMQHFYTFY